MSIRAKIAAGLCGVILLFAFLFTLQVRTSMDATLREEHRRRGLSVARDVAGQITDMLLTDNLFGASELVRDRFENDDDVRYVFVVDRSGDVVVHTFGEAFPPELLGANAVGPGDEFRMEVLETEEGLIYDAAVPILKGRLGTVRVGMSETRIKAVIGQTTLFVLFVAGCVTLLALAAAFLLTSVVTRPIFDITKAAKAIGAGKLGHQVTVRSGDELGKLGDAFNAMSEALSESRREIEDINRLLVRRNEELAALNAIALAVGSSLRLKDVLEGALEKVMEVMDVKAGWVFLRNGQEEHLNLAASKGLSKDFAEEEAAREVGDCVCREVMESGEARIVRDILKCPRLSREVLEREGLKRHVSVPLTAKESVLGIMNVARVEGEPFGDDEVKLLRSIGHQVGIAIENASLYERIQHKEAQRRRLLDKLIHAQEDERKRVARELHDEIGQSLTALTLGLATAEEMLPAGADGTRSHLVDMRSLASGVVAEIRRLIKDLRPSVLDDMGLVPAIRSYAENYLNCTGVEPHFEIVGHRKKLPPAVEIALFRVVQEAVTNIVKHAEARNATIRLRFREASVVATIEDDGKGFDPSLTGQDMTGFGLLGMQERVALLGGTWRIDSNPGKGTRIASEIPTPGDQDQRYG